MTGFLVFRCTCGMPIPSQGYLAPGDRPQYHPHLVTGDTCTGVISSDAPQRHVDSPVCTCYGCQMAKQARAIPHNPNRGAFCGCTECKAKLLAVSRSL